MILYSPEHTRRMSTPTNNIPFMKNMRIVQSKMPKYEEFRKPFSVKLNATHLKALTNTLDVGRLNPSITKIVESILGKMKDGNLEVTYAHRSFCFSP